MRRAMLAVGAGLALGIGAGLVLRARNPDPPPAETPALQTIDTREVTRRGLLYVVAPLWLGAGFADYLCHRATHIERNAGLKETLLHFLQLAEMGLPCLAALFLEITAPVLGLMALACVAHEATALWDLRYAVSRRRVSPTEQHVHSFLEILPLGALAFISALHWPKFLALLGLRRETDRWFRLKRVPLPVGTVARVLGSVVVFELAPYLEEAWRDWRQAPGRLVPPGPKAEQLGRRIATPFQRARGDALLPM
jgi:hypothetical protein